ncbi:hypothetical protein DPMN_015107 [Dreissena polymorpha]|uniref:Uncharacterized protein n=2 Tax=Dreissena polymorpha TaxID=45954 RepID=A0A9D4S450_DREPO|nr:hypothetical protein DPMN_015107 [Dreissena polymorpha]
MCVMVGVCYRLLKPVKTVLARRNKKKKDNPIPMPPTFENFNELVSGLERVCQCLHRSASSLDPIYLGLDLGTLSLAEHMPGDQEKDVAKEVWKKVEAGYQQSVLEITELLHKKLQYLGGLHL